MPANHRSGRIDSLERAVKGFTSSGRDNEISHYQGSAQDLKLIYQPLTLNQAYYQLSKFAEK